jgi:REP element-mobilizing transposase RayT
VDHQMNLNDAGKMVEKWFHELGNKYPDIECGEYVVMPNHFHCIVENNGNGNPNMKDKTGTTWKEGERVLGEHIGSPLRVCPHEMGDMVDMGMGEHIGSPQQGSPQQGSPVRNIVQWFKTMSTNEYIRGVKTMGWQRFDGKLWQKNYWEHIIRSQVSFDSISSYIYENPKNWNTDKLK